MADTQGTNRQKKGGRPVSRAVAVLGGLLPDYASRRINPALAVVRDSALEAQRAHLPQMAAALAFKTIFSLIPAIVIGMVLLQVFMLRGSTPEETRGKVASTVQQILEYTGVGRISVPEGTDLPDGEMGPPAPVQSTAKPVDGAAPAGEVPKLSSTGSEKLDEWIVKLVIQFSEVNFNAIGIIGLIGLIYAAISLLVEIEHAFNQIYRVPTGRSWVRRITQYWTLLTLGSVGLVATIGFGIRATSWFASTAQDITGLAASDTMVWRLLSGYGVNIVISTALFVLMYMVVPNARVKLWPAVAGAVVAATLWEAGKWGLTFYLRKSGGTVALYGSIALILFFFVWIQVSWMIILFGLSITYHLQHSRQLAAGHNAATDLPATITDPSAILGVMAHLSRGFDDGKAYAADDLARDLRLHPDLARTMLERLALGGFVNRLADDDQAPPRYAPARPADRIDASDVLRLGEELADPGLSSTSPVTCAMREARLQLVCGKTLAQFARVEPPPAPEPAKLPAADVVPLAT